MVKNLRRAPLFGKESEGVKESEGGKGSEGGRHCLQERQAVRRISLAERLHFCSFLSSVKPFLAHHPAQLIQERHQSLVNKMAAVVTCQQSWRCGHVSTKWPLWSRVNKMAAVVTCQQNGRFGHMSTKWPLWSSM